MIIWQGYGVLAVVFAVISLALAQYGIDAAMGQGFYTANSWPKVIAGIIGAISIGGIGYWLNSKPGKTLVDPNTGEQVELKQSHSLFWIPMQYWSVIFLAICIAIAYL